MRPSITAFVLCTLLGGAGIAHATDLPVLRQDAPIHDVTVYGREALIARSATFTADAAGPLRVVLARLPETLRDDSVRIRASAGLTLLGSRVARHAVASSSQPEVERLRAEKRRLLSERWEAQDAEEVAKKSIAYIEQLQKIHADEASKGIVLAADLELLTKQVEWTEKALSRALAARRAADDRVEEVDRQLGVATARLAEVEREGGAEKDLEVELQVTAPGALGIDVQYVIDGASWTPSYDLRADADAKAVEVTCFGNVTQKTGEDWQGVRLTLSSARPELGARPPELQPWAIAQIDPRIGGSDVGESRNAHIGTPGTWMPGIGHGSALDEARVARFDDTSLGDVDPEQRGATVAYTIAAPETIPSDGKPKKTTIARKVLDAKARYFTVPRLTPFAYVRATVTNGFDVPLLAGPASVFYGPDYVGKARVDLTPPGAPLECFLGVDERLRVERKLLKRTRDTTGLLSTDVRDRFETQITVKNTRDVQVEVTVLDQIPVSRSEHVKIQDVTLAPDPDAVDKKAEQSGERRWSLRVGARKEETIAVGFTVQFPESEEGSIVGLGQ